MAVYGGKEFVGITPQTQHSAVLTATQEDNEFIRNLQFRSDVTSQMRIMYHGALARGLYHPKDHYYHNAISGLTVHSKMNYENYRTKKQPLIRDFKAKQKGSQQAIF